MTNTEYVLSRVAKLGTIEAPEQIEELFKIFDEVAYANEMDIQKLAEGWEVFGDLPCPLTND